MLTGPIIFFFYRPEAEMRRVDAVVSELRQAARAVHVRAFCKASGTWEGSEGPAQGAAGDRAGAGRGTGRIGQRTSSRFSPWHAVHRDWRRVWAGACAHAAAGSPRAASGGGVVRGVPAGIARRAAAAVRGARGISPAAVRSGAAACRSRDCTCANAYHPPQPAARGQPVGVRAEPRAWGRRGRDGVVCGRADDRELGRGAGARRVGAAGEPRRVGVGQRVQRAVVELGRS